jgi:hypothetical protein
MPPNASSGFIPSKTATAAAVQSRSTGDLERLFFTTTFSHEHHGKTRTQDSWMENFDAIHKVGKKDTKYMKMKPKVAPLTKRSACKYTSEFGPKPLGDHACNKELAELLKGNFGPTKMDVDFANKTSYHEVFNMPRTQEHFDLANQPNQAPSRKIRTKTLGGTGETMVFRSWAQTEHGSKPQHLARPGETMLPKPNFMLGGTVTSDTYRTTNMTEYKRPYTTTSASAGSLYDNLHAELKNMKSRGFAEEDRMFAFRRACFLSPGQ